MSVAIPVVAAAFGSVTPPQEDILELQVHLGCTKEVSSFDCLLQNFDKKYTVTNPINVGDNCHFDIGRGENCPLIFTGRVEEIEPESTPVENYIRVRGRCWGEKIFRRVVTKTYENQKGEAIVKDLTDNYVGLSHVRDGTELIEETDTTYTLLEYENTPVFDVLKYIAESADKNGVIGFDFRVEWDGKFAFFPRNSKTSPISLSERIEVSRYSKDIHRVRNKITVYGAAEKADPSDKDGWTETLDINNDATNDWTSGTGTGSVSLDGAKKILGSYSIKHTTGTADYYGCAILTLPSGMEVDCNKHPSLTFQMAEQSAFNGSVRIVLEDAAGKQVERLMHISNDEKWNLVNFTVGKKNQDQWTVYPGNEGFNWASIKKILFYANFEGTGTGSFWIDNLFFNRRRFEATQEDSGSQTSYGVRELVEVDEELHSDNECTLRAKALLEYLSEPAEFLTVRSTCLDYGINRLLSGDKIHVTLPNENIDSDFRIISVEYRVVANEQTLETTLELGKEKPLLADYLYGLRATTVTLEKLMRTKAGLTGVAGSVGGGGGGEGGMVQHSNEWHDPDMALQSDFASHKDRHKSGGADAFAVTDLLDSIARVKVRKNNGSDVGARRRLNIVEGQNLLVTVSDDPTNEEVDLTLDAINQISFLTPGRYYYSLVITYPPTQYTAFSVDMLRATLYPITRKMTFNEAAIHMYFGEAGKKARLGIYDDLNGAPNNLIQDFGEVDISTAGLKTIAISPALQLNPGVYWLAVVMNSTTAKLYYSGFGYRLPLIGSTDSLIATPPHGYERSYTYGGLPNPFGSGNYSVRKWAAGLKLQSVP